ncbi:MAG: hypothetical protein Q4D96_14820 [Propionibacteriaceae bacterium]|nr:hypothetical protein [Propionibacteriaceae bacterium]
MNRRLLAGMVAAMTLVACTPSAPEPTPSPTVVHMRTEHADGYTFDPAEGWDEQSTSVMGEVPYTITEETNRSGEFRIRRTDGKTLLSSRRIEELGAVFLPGFPVDPQVVLKDRMLNREDYGKQPEMRVLPPRTVGGEPALGFSYRDQFGQMYKMEVWCVVRHDGVWEFDLRTNPNLATPPAELHQMLDSFRWTGPRPAPTATPS